MVDAARQERLRDIVREQKRRVWADLREDIFRKLGDEGTGNFDVPLDNAERSFVDLVQDAGLSIASIRQEELANMEEAERRMEQGTYGVCDECGEEIPEDRLEVVPFTRYCVACQQSHEGIDYPPPGGKTI